MGTVRHQEVRRAVGDKSNKCEVHMKEVKKERQLTWPERIALFVLWPVIAAFLAVGFVIFLTIIWPLMLSGYVTTTWRT